LTVLFATWRYLYSHELPLLGATRRLYPVPAITYTYTLGTLIPQPPPDLLCVLLFLSLSSSSLELRPRRLFLFSNRPSQGTLFPDAP
jgi:hypothetical protein